MGGIYRRGTKLWLWYFDPAGKRIFEPTSSRAGEEARARKTLELIERRMKAEKQTGVPVGEPLTIKAYGERWLKGRPAQGVGTAADEATRLRLHAWPGLGHLLLKDVRPHHIRDLVRALRTKLSARGTPLAPRTQRHVYGTLHALLHEAVVDELIASNPCALKRGELPGKIDKDPTWRSQAIFAREEVEQLISDERIPEERRVLYALLFLTGMRIGEVSACRWRAYDPTSKPLGRLLVATSFNRKKRLEKAVKTERPREVPAHPTLAKVLAAWKLCGWERRMGRAPVPDDLLIPSTTAATNGQHLLNLDALYALHRDLDLLGLRRRRVHDARRTFISLALADGARKDILSWVTHGPLGDITSLYTTLPWATLCEEVSKLKLELHQGRLLEFPRVAAIGCDSRCDSQNAEAKNASRRQRFSRLSAVHETGLEPVRPD